MPRYEYDEQLDREMEAHFFEPDPFGLSELSPEEIAALPIDDRPDEEDAQEAASATQGPAEASVGLHGRITYHGAEDGDHEWARYIWTAEGELCVGTFAEYIRDCQSSSYAGLDVSRELKTWDAVYEVTSDFEGSSDDYLHYRHEVTGPNGVEVVRNTLDGRA